MMPVKLKKKSVVVGIVEQSSWKIKKYSESII